MDIEQKIQGGARNFTLPKAPLNRNEMRYRDSQKFRIALRFCGFNSQIEAPDQGFRSRFESHREYQCESKGNNFEKETLSSANRIVSQ